MIIGSSPSTSRLRQLGCSAEDLAYGPEGLAARHCDLRRVTCLDRFNIEQLVTTVLGCALRASDPFLARHNREASLPCSHRSLWSGWRDLNPRTSGGCGC